MNLNSVLADYDSLRDHVNQLRFRFGELSPWHGHDNIPGENVFEFVAPETEVRIHGSGLGDLMIIRQFGNAFNRYVQRYGDPELGSVVVATGGWGPALHPTEGDVNLYWWWSVGSHENEPAQYLEDYHREVAVRPDVVLCLSEKCQREAEQLGYDTLYLPLGTRAFEPLNVRRSGIGYAGSKGHKETQSEQVIVSPVKHRDDFQWVSNYVMPSQLNLWYNTKEVTLGMTKGGQKWWGMVNNRVFETLASATPLVLGKHPNVEDVLGFEYPYQAESASDTVTHIKNLTANRDEIREEFRRVSREVRENHSYDERVNTVVSALK